jgi:hypothetical protein
MAKYLEKDKLAELDEYRRKIFELRAEAYTKSGIDVLDNDTLSALSIYEVVHQYDPDYNINFARNGEDSKSGGVLIEQKASRIEKKKRSGEYGIAGFQFHAMGNIEYDRYIFATRDKATLELVRIYDISGKANIKLIQKHLLAEREKWLERGRKDQKKMKHDVIVMPEAVLIESLKKSTKQIINNCEVVKA